MAVSAASSLTIRIVGSQPRRRSGRTEFFPNLGVFFRSAYNTPHESYLIFLSHTDCLRNLDIWTSCIGGFAQWFGRGKPLSTCFNADTGYAVRHELLRDGVRLARNWGEPGDPKGPFGYYTKTEPQAVALQPGADYARSRFRYTKVNDRDWFPALAPPAFPRVTPATEPKLDWTRQALFIKDADPAGPRVHRPPRHDPGRPAHRLAVLDALGEDPGLPSRRRTCRPSSPTSP